MAVQLVQLQGHSIALSSVSVESLRVSWHLLLIFIGNITLPLFRDIAGFLLKRPVPIPREIWFCHKMHNWLAEQLHYFEISRILIWSFITCVSINVIVSHSLYRAAVSALFSLVVLLIMHFKFTCYTIVLFW